MEGNGEERPTRRLYLAALVLGTVMRLIPARRAWDYDDVAGYARRRAG